MYDPVAAREIDYENKSRIRAEINLLAGRARIRLMAQYKEEQDLRLTHGLYPMELVDQPEEVRRIVQEAIIETVKERPVINPLAPD